MENERAHADANAQLSDLELRGAEIADCGRAFCCDGDVALEFPSRLAYTAVST